MKRNVENIIPIVIVFISTAIIPNLLIYILQIDMNVALLSAIISSVVLGFLKLLQHNLELRSANESLKQDEDQLVDKSPQKKIEQLLLEEYDEMRIYAISSRHWADVYQKKNLRAKKCTILVRKHIDDLCDKARYEKEVQEAIECWKRLLREGRLNQLIVYEYSHIPDHYFGILDDKVLITGLHIFDSLDSTGQHGDRNPQYIFDDGHSELIKKYTKHFQNYLERYSDNKLYDSTTQ